MLTALLITAGVFALCLAADIWLILTGSSTDEEIIGFRPGPEPIADPGRRQHHAGGSARASFHGADYV